MHERHTSPADAAAQDRHDLLVVLAAVVVDLAAMHTLAAELCAEPPPDTTELVERARDLSRRFNELDHSLGIACDRVSRQARLRQQLADQRAERGRATGIFSDLDGGGPDV